MLTATRFRWLAEDQRSHETFGRNRKVWQRWMSERSVGVFLSWIWPWLVSFECTVLPQIEQTQTATYHWMNWWSNCGISHSCWVVMPYLIWWIVEDYAVAAALALTILDKQMGRFPLPHSPNKEKLSRSTCRLIYKHPIFPSKTIFQSRNIFLEL